MEPRPKGLMRGRGGSARCTRSALMPFALLLLGALLGYMLGVQRSTLLADSPPRATERADVAARGLRGATLVLYSYFAGDEASRANLDFFLRHGVGADDGVDYVVIMNGYERPEDLEALALPPLPRNARYVLHRNECYDWGTYAWALHSVVNAEAYEYFIFINSSVRGPLLPWYAAGAQHWTRLFTGKLSHDVKLVGPAISCEHFCMNVPDERGGSRRECRRNPHVQSVAVATDQVGLAVLRDARSVLRCHASRGEAVFFGEIGASLAIENAGFNIDSFLTRYQGVDWRVPGHANCNAGVSPIGKNTFDGLTVSAYEMVFPKVKGSLLASQGPSHVEADRLSRWTALPVDERNITSNWLMVQGKQLHAADVLVQQAKGIDCFDWPFYRQKNPDMAKFPREVMWQHFLARGALEFREHRWTCELDADAIVPRWPPKR